MSDYFDKRLAKARVYERAVSIWLMARGWRVLPTYEFSGKSEDKAPKLEARRPSDSLVLPDLLACRGGVSKWAEVKYKSCATFYRKTKTWETGISLRHFEHYQQVMKSSGLNVWLMFVHEAEAQVRGASIENLSRPGAWRAYRGSGMGRDKMAFFPWNSLRVFAPLSDVKPPETMEAA